MMMMILVIMGTCPLSSIAFPAQEEKPNTLLFPLHGVFRCEKDTNFAPFRSSPLNFGATENSK